VAHAPAAPELSPAPAGRVVSVGDAGTSASLALEPGPLHARLVVADVPLGDLPAGTRLRVGATAVVELTDEPGRGLREAGSDSTTVGARVVEGGTVGIGEAVVIEAVAIPLEDVLDLHPFRPDEIVDVVREYLTRAQAAGYAEVRLIHGRGRGIQREAVRRLLATVPAVAAFADAPAERGGWGATIAWLRGDPAPPSPAP
jgi:hypothetical protein